ncbi:MAG: NAD(P)/FAD-dependent oxidoreductase [Phycisphaerales bacterium]
MGAGGSAVSPANAGDPIAIIGGGPAGASAALRLAVAGQRAVLVERAVMPRSKVCGGCLNRRSIGALQQLGVWPPPDGMAHPLRRVDVRVAPGRRGRAGTLAGRVRPKLGGTVAVERSRFDAWMLDRVAAAGVEVIMPVRAEAVSVDAGGPGVLLASPATSGGGPDASVVRRAKIVLAADGLGGSALRAWPPAARARRRVWPVGRTMFGFGGVWADGWRLIDEDLVMIVGDAGYVGVARLPGGSIDVSAAASPGWVRRNGGPSVALGRLLAGGGLNALAERIVSGEGPAIGGTPRLATCAAHPALPGVLRIGDAMGYAEPFTGEGMAWAMGSGIEAADVLIEAGDGLTTDRGRHAVETRWRSIARRRRRAMLGCLVLGTAIGSRRRARVALAAARQLPPFQRVVLNMMGRGEEARPRSGAAS